MSRDSENTYLMYMLFGDEFARATAESVSLMLLIGCRSIESTKQSHDLVNKNSRPGPD